MRRHWINGRNKAMPKPKKKNYIYIYIIYKGKSGSKNVANPKTKFPLSDSVRIRELGTFCSYLTNVHLISVVILSSSIQTHPKYSPGSVNAANDNGRTQKSHKPKPFCMSIRISYIAEGGRERTFSTFGPTP